MPPYDGRLSTLLCRTEGSLSRFELATYERDDQFDQSAALGFIKLYGLPQQVQAEQQLLPEHQEPLKIAMPG